MIDVAKVEVVDSHTEGEPTRVVIAGWPDTRGPTVTARRDVMRHEHDALRAGVVREPRGHDAIVGALLVPADRPEAATGVVFFNDVGYLGMCGHGTIGVVRTLQHLGRIGPGHVELDTPVGPVSAELDADGSVTIRNVPARLHQSSVTVDVPGLGRISGDVAWGGNWFFLATVPGLAIEPANQSALLHASEAIRAALGAAGITGSDGGLIDHVELFGPSSRADADSRNFVLCPGRAWDRSPCGTGTSAKLAALHAHGQLAIGQRWRQESMIGSVFTGWLETDGTDLIPHIQGRAFITGRSTLLFDPDDPYRQGLP
ncbi:MAG TPA: proline racemase family protein [Gemmatimonadales bacterium]|jgi:4-hydroxyproline epimerase